MAVKIDIRKAFDTLSWDFLLSVLHQMAFSPTAVGWILSLDLHVSPFSLTDRRRDFSLVLKESDRETPCHHYYFAWLKRGSCSLY